MRGGLLFYGLWKNGIMQAEQVRHYVARASEFYKTMRLLQGADGYANACALLAIHSAVSFTDALRSGLGDRELAGEDHRSAASALRKLMAHRSNTVGQGTAHLEKLIAEKSSVAYGSSRLEAKDYQTVTMHAERYASWANRMGRELKIEGWINDDA